MWVCMLTVFFSLWLSLSLFAFLIVNQSAVTSPVYLFIYFSSPLWNLSQSILSDLRKFLIGTRTRCRHRITCKKPRKAPSKLILLSVGYHQKRKGNCDISFHNGREKKAQRWKLMWIIVVGWISMNLCLLQIPWKHTPPQWVRLRPNSEQQPRQFLVRQIHTRTPTPTQCHTL